MAQVVWAFVPMVVATSVQTSFRGPFGGPNLNHCARNIFFAALGLPWVSLGFFARFFGGLEFTTTEHGIVWVYSMDSRLFYTVYKVPGIIIGVYGNVTYGFWVKFRAESEIGLSSLVF